MMTLIRAESIGVSFGYITYYDGCIDEDDISTWMEENDQACIICEEAQVLMTFSAKTMRTEAAIIFKGIEKYGLPFSVEKIYISDLEAIVRGEDVSPNEWNVIE